MDAMAILHPVGYVVVAYIALRVFAALLTVVLQRLFGPNPPPHIAKLMDASIAVFRARPERALALLRHWRQSH